MLTTFPDLLPPTSTPFESALAGPTGRITAIPVPLRDLWRWDTCPEDHLPWLAWAMSVDLWSDDWPVEKKRAMIRDSFELHRRKGTEWCIERYLSFAGAKLRKAIVPPAKVFPSRSMTAEERAAWHGRFPQLRVYPFRTRGAQTYGAYFNSSYKHGKAFFADKTFFPSISDAADRLGRRAFLWDKGPHPLATGEETPLRWLERNRVPEVGEAVDYERVLIPGHKVPSLFFGNVRGNHNGKNGRMFCVASTANARVVTLDVRRQYTTETEHLVQKAVTPSLEPLQAFPVQIGERGTSKRGHQMFCGMRGKWLDPETGEHKVIKSFLCGYLPPSTAPLRIYDQFYLHDKRRLPDPRGATLFMGNARFGMPAFEAELSVEIRGKRSKYAFGRFMTGFFVASDQTALRQSRQAVQRSMALRDKILLRTQLHKPVTASSGVRTTDNIRSGGLITTH